MKAGRGESRLVTERHSAGGVVGMGGAMRREGESEEGRGE